MDDNSTNNSVTVFNFTTFQMNGTNFTNIQKAGDDLLRLMGIGIIGGLLTLFIVVGNLLVLVIFRSHRQLRKKNYYFVVNLAIADLVIGLNSVPGYTLYLAIGYWPFGRIACDIWLTVDYLACAVALFTIIAISIDRYQSLKDPIKHMMETTKKRILRMVAITWVVAVVMYAMPIALWPHVQGFYEFSAEECVIDYLNHTWFTWTQTALGFWLPMAILIILYIRIYAVAKKVANRKTKRATGALNMFTKNTPNNHKEQSSEGNNLSTISGEVQKISHGKGKCPSLTNKERGHRNSVQNERSLTGTCKAMNSNSSRNGDRRKECMSADNENILCPLELDYINVSEKYDNTLCTEADNAEIDGNASVFVYDNPAFEDATNTTKHSCMVDAKTPVTDIRTDTSDVSQTGIVTKLDVKSSQDGITIDIDIRTPEVGQGNNEPIQNGRVKSPGTDNRQANGDRKCPKQRSKDNRASTSNDNKALSTVTTLVVAIVVCCMPYHLAAMGASFCPSCFNPALFNAFYWIYYTNSALDPLCYAYSIKQFRRSLHSLFCRCKLS
ncbi:muscarinic acetylcholine receptor M2-like [Glandiceps talaboti]